METQGHETVKGRDALGDVDTTEVDEATETAENIETTTDTDVKGIV